MELIHFWNVFCFVSGCSKNNMIPNSVTTFKGCLINAWKLIDLVVTLPRSVNNFISDQKEEYCSHMELIPFHCELRVSVFQLPLKWTSWGGTEATALEALEAKDGWSRFSLSIAGQLIQQWCLLCNFWMAQSQCSLLNENNFQLRRILLSKRFSGFYRVIFYTGIFTRVLVTKKICFLTAKSLLLYILVRKMQKKINFIFNPPPLPPL